MPFTRRELLGLTASMASAALVARRADAGPAWIQTPATQPPAPPTDAVGAIRAQMGAVPISTRPLSDGMVMLSGPGGNVIVQSGVDGKVVVDSFLQPAWPKLKATIDAMGPGPIVLLIDTHWHVDHTDNNANFHHAGADVLAHDNTRKRLNEAHDLMGMHFEPVTPSARPTETFRTARTVTANGESIEAVYIQPAHTDGDIYVWFPDENVLHMGDVFFNGMYPFMDIPAGGGIAGMIAGAAQGLSFANDQTRIVPGHGPLGDKAALQRAHDMLVTVRDRVKTLKDAKKSLADTIAAKPTADLDAAWGNGFTKPEVFVRQVWYTV